MNMIAIERRPPPSTKQIAASDSAPATATGRSLSFGHAVCFVAEKRSNEQKKKKKHDGRCGVQPPVARCPLVEITKVAGPPCQPSPQFHIHAQVHRCGVTGVRRISQMASAMAAARDLHFCFSITIVVWTKAWPTACATKMMHSDDVVVLPRVFARRK